GPRGDLRDGRHPGPGRRPGDPPLDLDQFRGGRGDPPGGPPPIHPPHRDEPPPAPAGGGGAPSPRRAPSPRTAAALLPPNAPPSRINLTSPDPGSSRDQEPHSAHAPSNRSGLVGSG